MKNFYFLTFICLMLIFLLNSCKKNSVNFIPFNNGESYQYVDKDGKIIINPQFINATIFREGIALVQTSGEDSKWGFINEKGMFINNAQYKSATIFNEGLAWVVQTNDAPTAIDTKGKIIFTLKNAEKVRVFKEGLAAFSVINEKGEIKFGFVNKEGNIVINPIYNFVTDFSSGLSGVKNEKGKIGFINEKGKIVISYQFDNVQEFKDNQCIVRIGEKYGVIDKKGKFVINPQFTNLVYDQDLYMIYQKDKIGWSDDKGMIVINPQFTEALPFNGTKLAPVKIGKTWGYIDREGKIVINPQFDFAYPFMEDRAVVVSEKMFGMIDDKGKYIVNPQYSNVSNDYLFQTFFSKSYYEEVESDYFDIEKITSLINVDQPEGITYGTSYATIIKTLNIDPETINVEYGEKYSTRRVTFFSYKRLNKETTYDFSTYSSSPYTTVSDPQSWDLGNFYETRIIDTTNKANNFEFLFFINSNNPERVSSVFKSINDKIKTNNVKSLEIEKSRLGEDTHFYEMENKSVVVGMDGNKITIFIKQLN